jgi:hypothetical protein
MCIRVSSKKNYAEGFLQKKMCRRRSNETNGFHISCLSQQRWKFRNMSNCGRKCNSFRSILTEKTASLGDGPQMASIAQRVPIEFNLKAHIAN